MDFRTISKTAGLGLAAAAMAACSSGGGNNDGTLSVSLMDAPVDHVDALYVDITEAWIKPQEGPAFELELNPDVEMPVDLLALTEENAALLIDAANLEANRYNWLELRINDLDSASYAMTDSGEMMMIDIDVPSDRIRLVSGFDVGPNEVVQFLFDWDVRKGLTNPVGRDVYILKPAFRMLEVNEYSVVTGSVAPEVLSDMANDCLADDSDPNVGNVVYVFDGDVDFAGLGQLGGMPDPAATARATANEDGSYGYRVPLEPGDYTIAFTCQGGLDDSEVPDDLFSFVEPIDDAAIDNDDFVTVTDVVGEFAGPNF